MKAVVTGRLRRLQRLPHIVQGFFADPERAYITAVPEVNLRAIFLVIDGPVEGTGGCIGGAEPHVVGSGVGVHRHVYPCRVQGRVQALVCTQGGSGRPGRAGGTAAPPG